MSAQKQLSTQRLALDSGGGGVDREDTTDDAAAAGSEPVAAAPVDSNATERLQQDEEGVQLPGRQEPVAPPVALQAAHGLAASIELTAARTSNRLPRLLPRLPQPRKHSCCCCCYRSSRTGTAWQRCYALQWRLSDPRRLNRLQCLSRLPSLPLLRLLLMSWPLPRYHHPLVADGDEEMATSDKDVDEEEAKEVTEEAPGAGGDQEEEEEEVEEKAQEDQPEALDPVFRLDA